MNVLDPRSTSTNSQTSQWANRNPTTQAPDRDESESCDRSARVDFMHSGPTEAKSLDATSADAKSPQTLGTTDSCRWITDLQSLRDRILQDPQYAPEVLIRRHRARLQRIRARQRMAVACGILCVVAPAIWLSFNHGRSRTAPWMTYQREAAQMDPVLLQDGSVFQLNDHSRVRVNLTESTRHVLVESGEVFFEVNPDIQRPFDVQAGTAGFIAKGTAFSVRKDENGEVETTVVDGIVEVEVPRRPRLYRGAPEELPAENPETGVRDINRVGETPRAGETRNVAETEPAGEVKAGEVGTISTDGQFSVTRVEEADLTKRLAWADPVRSLDGMTLTEAVALFNRYNVRKLEITDPELGRMRVSGRYHLTQPERFVEGLGQLGVSHVTQGPESSAGARIVLMRK